MTAPVLLSSGRSRETVNVTSASVRSLIAMSWTSPTRTPATLMSSPSSRLVTSLNTAR